MAGSVSAAVPKMTMMIVVERAGLYAKKGLNRPLLACRKTGSQKGSKILGGDLRVKSKASTTNFNFTIIKICIHTANRRVLSRKMSLLFQAQC